LMTHIIVRGDGNGWKDCVFGVAESLIKDFIRHEAATPTPDGRTVEGTWTDVRLDTVLARAERRCFRVAACRARAGIARLELRISTPARCREHRGGWQTVTGHIADGTRRRIGEHDRSPTGKRSRRRSCRERFPDHREHARVARARRTAEESCRKQYGNP